jgi:DNA-binding CsgD family transcriptional regulator
VISYSGLGAISANRMAVGAKLSASVISLLRLTEELGVPAAVLVGGSVSPVGNDLFQGMFEDCFEKTSSKSRYESNRQMLVAARSKGTRTYAPFRHQGNCFVLHVSKMRLASDSKHEEEVELIRVHRLERANPLPIHCVSELYDLTRREAELALEIASGVSVAHYAKSRSLSKGTVRIQLKSIFRKTDTHSQTELCALLRPNMHFAE